MSENRNETAAVTIDAIGLLCPLPVLRLRKRLLALQPGERVVLVADDPAAVIDVPHFCAEQGHVLIEARTASSPQEYVVERGGGHGAG